jgi:hypothetical protein
VFSCHVRLPIKPRTSRASVGECATPRCTVHRILHRKSWPHPHERRYVPGVCCVSLLHQHRRVRVTARRTGLRASRVTESARATVVVKRKTRNNGNTHHQPIVPRVQPLLKCAPSFVPNP